MRVNSWIGLGFAALFTACAFGEMPGREESTTDSSTETLQPQAVGASRSDSPVTDAPMQRAGAVLRDREGREVAIATLVQEENGVHFSVISNALPAGRLAVHVHENGVCEPPDFASAGGHFAPRGHQHGLENPAGPHAGDLPNIRVAPDGAGEVEALNPWVSLREGETGYLLESGGTSIVVHEMTDDYFTDPSGNSGDRIACGVVEP